MKVEVNISKKYFLGIIGLLLVLVGIIGVNAALSDPAPNPGHHSSELAGFPDCAANEFLKHNNDVWTCEPINIPQGSSSDVNKLDGSVEITFFDHTGDTERCGYTVRIDNTELLSGLSPNLDELSTDKCHRWIYGEIFSKLKLESLRLTQIPTSLQLGMQLDREISPTGEWNKTLLSEIVGVDVWTFSIDNYIITTQGQSSNDATFDFYYVEKTSP